jgi:predicted nucleic acid-binding protein
MGSRCAENIGSMRVFDSNILIYHLNDALPSSVLNNVESWITEGAVISVMSRIEVLGYPQTADQLQQAMRLLAYFDEIPLHEPVVQRTITLRQQYRIRLPDALIAATALYLDFPLVTRNTRDFQTINGLIILNPFE